MRPGLTQNNSEVCPLAGDDRTARLRIPYRANAVRRVLVILLVVLVSPTSRAAAQSIPEVGYTELTPLNGTAVPTGSAVISNRNAAGVLVSEAGVAAVETLMRGRIFVDQGGTRTGMAIVNPQSVTSALDLTLRDTSGNVVGQTILIIGPGQHRAMFVDELFSGLPSGFRGSLTFTSLSGHGAITLRESRNGFSEQIYTTLPVADLDAAQSSDPLTFPHLAAGGGFLTEVVLINRTSALAEGRIRFIGSDGLPMVLTLDGVQTSEVSYQLAPDGVFRTELAGGSQVQAGYAVLTPTAGSTPSGSVIFKLLSNGQLASETGVGATSPTDSAKISLDNVGRQTGFALANPGLQPADVKIRLQDHHGVTQSEVLVTIAGGGHFARMAQELFPTIESGFSGLIEISSTVPVVPITLQITVNLRGVPVLTTLPVADLNVPPVTGAMIFPQVVIGGAFQTRFVVIAGQPSEYTLTFRRPDATDWLLPAYGAPSVNFQLGAGDGLRIFPGHDGRVAYILFRDPVTNSPTTELSMTVGSSMQPRILVLDTLGNARDDLPLGYASLDTSVATVSPTGLIDALAPGFSTLVASRDDVIATATITVVTGGGGTSSGFATGVAESATGVLFLTSSSEHTIRKDENHQTTLYAGSPNQAGFQNDLPLMSRFDSPTYITVNRATGDLYVADTGNHAIRGIPSGAGASVVTLSGKGVAGFADGGPGTAMFDSPKGVALDDQGYLWVVDQSNHAIRRVNVATGVVQTIAGMPGQAGNQDGVGSSARFDSPTGIAIEPEGIAEQLLREALGGPPPPVRVVVTDTANGTVRRITELGDVSTVTAGVVSAFSTGSGEHVSAATGGSPLTFNSPTGIAVSRVGTIYVTESGAGQLSSIFLTGEVSTVGAPGSFNNPSGVTVGEGGEIFVASTGTALAEIPASAPLISSITPNPVAAAGGQRVDVRGEGFERDAVLVVAQVPIPITFYDATHVSFVTPPLPQGVTTLALTTRAGSAFAAFQVGPTASFTFGSVIAGEIVQLGESDSFPFFGNAGDQILLTLVETGGAFVNRTIQYSYGPTAELTAPSGVVVIAPWSSLNLSGAARQAVLPETGTYLVRVRASDFLTTGTYNLGLERLSPPTAVDATMNFGAVLTGDIKEAAQNDLITFSGTAGDQVLLNLVETGGAFVSRTIQYSYGPTAELTAPSGVVVVAPWSSLNLSGAARQAVLPETGTYLVRVRASDFLTTGTYNLALVKLN